MTRYLRYRRKLERRKRFLAHLYAAKILLLMLLIATVAAAVIVGITGKVHGEEFAPAATYGEELIPQAKAYFRPVSYEYSADGGETWEEAPPIRVGTYRCRAVSKNISGAATYGKVHEYSILPAEKDVFIRGEEGEYGTDPEVYAELFYDDALVSASVGFEPIDGYSYSVHADLGAARVVSPTLGDVTDCYLLRSPEKTYTRTPRPITVGTGSGEWVYDGAPHSVKTLKILSLVGLLEGHEIVAEFPEIVEVGTAENRPTTLAILDENGVDVTRNYQLGYEYGELKVEKQPLEIVMATGSAVYDGNAHSPEAPSVFGLISGHRLEAETFTAVEAGSYPNALKTFRIVDGKGEDKTSDYEITSSEGTFTVEKRTLNVRTATKDFLYDAEAHSDATFTLDGAAEGHTATGSATGHPEISDVGSIPNSVTVTVQVTDETGGDVTQNYNIVNVFGTLRVTPRTIIVTTGSLSWVYDGVARRNREISATFSEPALAGHTIQAETVTEASEAGNYPNEARVTVTCGGLDVTKNYRLDASLGWLSVSPRLVRVSTGSKEFVYDGTPQKWEEFTLLAPQSAEEGLLSGHLASAHSEGRIEITDTDSAVQTCDNILTFTVLDGDGVDRSKNYAFSGEWGKIRVKSPILVRVFSMSKYYDGTPLSYDGDEYRIEALPPDFERSSLTIRISGERTDAGEVSLDEIRMGSLLQVTGTTENSPVRVDLVGDAAPLRILRRTVVVSSVSVSLGKGEEPLSGNFGTESAWISYGSLAAGHTIEIAVEGVLTLEEESAENTIGEVHIFDAEHNEVTQNYEIVRSPGILRWL